jgi:hypothetical protein
VTKIGGELHNFLKMLHHSHVEVFIAIEWISSNDELMAAIKKGEKI